MVCQQSVSTLLYENTVRDGGWGHADVEKVSSVPRVLVLIVNAAIL